MSLSDPIVAEHAFSTELKRWRGLRKFSQLELALAANVSQRHISWLETGKSAPSRQMIVQLCEAMDVPLRARNALLISGGFAPAYRESQLDAEQMVPINDALRVMLDHHQPFPAFVVDRDWCVHMTNAPADLLLSAFGESIWDRVDPSGKRSLARLTLHPEGLKPFVGNWHELAGHFLQRMQREVVASGNAAHRQAFEELVLLAADDDIALTDFGAPLMPVLPLVLNLFGTELRLFSMISTFGTPQDITVDELRIELFFPADEATRLVFERAAAASATA